MESSFKKTYERNVLSDGTIEITHKQVRIPPSAATAFFLVATIILLPTSCAITGAFWGYEHKQSNAGWSFATVVLYVVLIFAISRLLGVGTNHLLIKPNIGVVINGKNLPYADIQTIGVNTIVNGNKKGDSYAYADSHGTKIPLTKHVSASLANAISEEVKNASGHSWG